MSKITNDGLTRSGTECFISVPIWQLHVGIKGLRRPQRCTQSVCLSVRQRPSLQCLTFSQNLGI